MPAKGKKEGEWVLNKGASGLNFKGTLNLSSLSCTMNGRTKCSL